MGIRSSGIRRIGERISLFFRYIYAGGERDCGMIADNCV